MERRQCEIAIVTLVLTLELRRRAVRGVCSQDRRTYPVLVAAAI
jgi:hypothetical protein